MYKSRFICWWVSVTKTSVWRNGKCVHVSVCVCVSFPLLSFKLSSGCLFSPHHVNQGGVQKATPQFTRCSFDFVIFFPLVVELNNWSSNHVFWFWLLILANYLSPCVLHYTNKVFCVMTAWFLKGVLAGVSDLRLLTHRFPIRMWGRLGGLFPCFALSHTPFPTLCWNQNTRRQYPSGVVVFSSSVDLLLYTSVRCGEFPFCEDEVDFIC